MTKEQRSAFIESAVAAEDDATFAGQPSKPKGKKTTTKSKKDKSPAAGHPETLTASSQAAKKQGKVVMTIEMGGMTITEKTVHRSMAGTSSETWKAVIKAWLSKHDVYTKAHRDDNIASLIRRLIPIDKDTESFFSTKNSRGIGQLYPTRTFSQDERHPQTLELHRAVLALEQDCEAMLRAIARAVPGLASNPYFEPAMLADVKAALEAKGGVGGQGPEYWSGKLEPEFPKLGEDTPGLPDSALAPTLHQLASLRPQAFERRYLVADENAWGLPILATVFSILAEEEMNATSSKEGRRKELTSRDYMHRIQRANGFRLTAVGVDQANLIHYGKLLSAYANRLREIASEAGVERAEAGRSAFDRLETSVSRNRFEVINCRKADEDADVDRMLRGLLFVRSAPAVDQIRRVGAAVADAMREDSHQRQLTHWLPASPSLSWASNDPVKYLCGGSRKI